MTTCDYGEFEGIQRERFTTKKSKINFNRNGSM